MALKMRTNFYLSKPVCYDSQLSWIRGHNASQRFMKIGPFSYFLERLMNTDAFLQSLSSRTMVTATDDSLKKEVCVSRGVGSRVATLNRPKTLNALTTPMVKRLRKLYEKWEHEDDISMVILKGAGGAFCSGADVKELYNFGLQGMFDSCREFFREMYRLSYILGTYKKIQVSIMDGIAMGGAGALTVHGEFRMATERTVFVVPETQIGFHPDVGGSFFLSRIQGSVGEYLALSGERLDIADMIVTRYATNPIHNERISEILHQLHALNTDDPEMVEQVVVGFEEGIDIDHDSFLSRLDTINRCFSKDTVEEIIDALESDSDGPDYSWYRKVIDTMRSASPISLKIALRSIRQARQETLSQCLKREYRLSCRITSGNVSADFYEGVRARLVDKTQNPKWNPLYLDQITPDMVEHYFMPFDNPDEELILPVEEREGISDPDSTVILDRAFNAINQHADNNLT